MIVFKAPVIAALSATLVLGACTDPASFQVDPNDPNARAKRGALIGAGIGAILGAGESRDRAVAGAVLGGVAGGIIGNLLDEQAAALRNDLNNDQVTITNTGDRLIVTLPQDILFATDSFTVRPDLQSDLRAVAGNLLDYPNSTIQIVGHTDNVGSAEYNQGLSVRRSNAVADVLIDAGVPFTRVSAIGRGETQPVASNLSPEGRSQNRRVEIVILPNAA